jgi:hypothetical protein
VHVDLEVLHGKSIQVPLFQLSTDGIKLNQWIFEIEWLRENTSITKIHCYTNRLLLIYIFNILEYCSAIGWFWGPVYMEVGDPSTGANSFAIWCPKEKRTKYLALALETPYLHVNRTFVKVLSHAILMYLV